MKVAVAKVSRIGREEFYRKDGIVYRRCEMKGTNQFVRNIKRILPEQWREGVMGSVSTMETSPDSQTYKVHSGGKPNRAKGSHCWRRFDKATIR